MHYSFNKTDIIKANMVISILNAEIEGKVLDKYPFNRDVYAFVSYCFENASKAYITNNQGGIFGEPTEYDLNVLKTVKEMCSNFGLVDVTESRVVEKYIQDILDKQEQVWELGDVVYFAPSENNTRGETLILSQIEGIRCIGGE